jgi:hypothetical protein
MEKKDKIENIYAELKKRDPLAWCFLINRVTEEEANSVSIGEEVAIKG